MNKSLIIGIFIGYILGYFIPMEVVPDPRTLPLEEQIKTMY